MNDLLALLIVSACIILGMILGNRVGDQATLRDCATKSEAKMVGGGTIECTVQKESK